MDALRNGIEFSLPNLPMVSFGITPNEGDSANGILGQGNLAGNLADGVNSILGKDSAKNAKSIDQVAEGFESAFFSQLLKSMREATPSDESGGLFPGDKSDVLGGLWDMYLGQHLAQSGSLGVGAMVKKYLQNQTATETNVQRTNPNRIQPASAGGAMPGTPG